MSVALSVTSIPAQRGARKRSNPQLQRCPILSAILFSKPCHGSQRADSSSFPHRWTKCMIVKNRLLNQWVTESKSVGLGRSRDGNIVSTDECELACSTEKRSKSRPGAKACCLDTVPEAQAALRTSVQLKQWFTSAPKTPWPIRASEKPASRCLHMDKNLASFCWQKSQHLSRTREHCANMARVFHEAIVSVPSGVTSLKPPCKHRWIAHLNNEKASTPHSRSLIPSESNAIRFLRVNN